MPEIKFTVTPSLPRDIVHLAYKAGDVVELPEASCQRWIRRGVAEYVTAKGVEKPVEAKADPKAEEKAEEKVVDDVVPAVEAEKPAEAPVDEAAPVADETYEDKPKRGRRR